MARRSKRRRDHETRSLAPAVGPVHRTRPRSALGWLEQWEDRRDFHPEGNVRPARAFRNYAARSILVTPPSSSVRKVSRTSFAYPKAVPICVRRKERREVLMAIGKGGGRHSPPKRNAYSNISCKR